MSEARPTPLPGLVLRRVGALLAPVTLLLGIRTGWLATQSVVVRLEDYGWFWLPLRILRRLDSSLRMKVAVLAEPWPIEGPLEGPLSCAGVLGKVLLAHLPIVVLIVVSFSLFRPRGCGGGSRWFTGAVLTFAFPGAVLVGHELATSLSLSGLPRLTMALAVAAGVLLVLGLASRPMAPWVGARSFPGWALLVLLLIAAVLPAGSQPEEDPTARLPNILLISVDSLRADHVGSYGYSRPTTPEIDRLAAQGARFDVALAPTSWTLPSHMSLLTGLSPWSHGVIDSDRVLSASIETLAERLSAHGYQTFAVVSGRYLDASFGYARGFDSYDDYSMNLEYQHLRPAQRSVNASMLDRFERILERWQGQSRPFFVFLHLFDVHFDYLPVAPYDELFAESVPESPVEMVDFSDNEAIHPAMPSEQLRYVVSQYDGEIGATDQLIGRLVGLLELEGALDETIVVVTSDHGEEFFEHGRKGHRASLYEESVRIPLVIRYPPVIPAGTVILDPVGLEDVGSTLLGLAGLRRVLGTESVEGAVMSRDLSRALRSGGPTTGSPPTGSQSVYFGSLHEELFSARSPEFKLIVDMREEPPRERLYHLGSDPAETIDVISRYPREAERLRQQLTAWLEARGHSAGRRDLPDDVREDLEALGYLD